MKLLYILMISAVPCFASAAAGPVALGVFGDWTAATYGSGAAKACYAFTKAAKSSPPMAKRGLVMLTVTQRRTAHDEVTLSAGYDYPAKPSVTLSAGGAPIAFYTQGGTAFTSSNTAAIAAFQGGSTAVATSSAPGGGVVTDNFSLSGFSAAYAAIAKACP